MTEQDILASISAVIGLAALLIAIVAVLASANALAIVTMVGILIGAGLLVALIVARNAPGGKLR